jgi:hypothetical protein
MKRTDRARRDPRVPQEASREVTISDERRLTRRAGIGKERVLDLEEALGSSPPRVMRANELVRGENAAAKEERREKDQVENEERRDAVASGLAVVQRGGGKTIASGR